MPAFDRRSFKVRRGLFALLLLAGLAPNATADGGPAIDPSAFAIVSCPAGLAAGSECRSGLDGEGASVSLAVPRGWDGTLIVHAHGGPELGRLRPERPVEDLVRWSIWNRLGYAYAGSGYRQTGVAIVSAAEDIERARRIFIAIYGVPKRTILHGNSWGAGVAAKAAERDDGSPDAQGHKRFDGVLLTSGVLGGGTASYDFRLDLRVVYEAVCANHPAAGEPAYPLWQGLPSGDAMSRAELARRIDACTGIHRKPGARSPEQARRLHDIVSVVRIRESSLVGHLDWATWGLQDIAFRRLDGRNAFGNEGIRYVGTSDDDALNARVARYRADAEAVRRFDADAGLEGRIAVPVLTLHAIDDPTAFVELESTFRDIMQRGGSADRLVQTFSDDHSHSYLADAEYVAAIGALIDWVAGGARPSPVAVARRCARADPAYSPEQGCRFRPDYAPAPLSSRVPAR